MGTIKIGKVYQVLRLNHVPYNAIERYYSTSLITHRKKQFRTEGDILNQIKLSSMKRAGPKPTLLKIFRFFRPFAIS